MATTSTPIHSPPRASSSGFKKLSPKKQLTNNDLDEQIRRLELEGNFLRSSIEDSLTRSQHISPGKKPMGNHVTGKLALSLSDLVDSSGDHNTLTALSKELEAQSDRNEQLRQTLLRNREETGSLANFHYASTGTLLDKLKPSLSVSSSAIQKRIPCSELKPFAASSRSSLTNRGEDDVLDLQTKLEDSNAIIEKQKEQFHRALEDMRRKYESDIATKDALLRAKDRETAGHSDALAKLRHHIEQLQLTKTIQEQTVGDLQEKLDVHQREERLVEMALGQVRGQVLDQERKRGRPFYDGTPLLQQDVAAFVRSIEKCIQELDMDLELRNDQVNEMTAKLNRNKEVYQEKEKKLQQDFQLRLSQLKEEHKEAMDLESEQITSLRKQMCLLEDETSRQRSQLEHQILLKDASLSDLESRLRLAKEDLMAERNALHTKRQSLEAAMQNAERELASLKLKESSTAQDLAALEMKYAELQETFSKTKANLESTLEQVCHANERETSLTLRQNLLEDELRKKNVILEDLERKMEIIRQENEAHIKQMMASVEKEGEQNSERKVQALLIQLNALTEKCHRLTLDLELTKSNHHNLQEKYSELRTSHETLNRQLETATIAKERLSSVLSERLTEVTRAAHERDAQSKLAETSAVELSSLRCLKDRLAIQLEEREKNFLAVKEQNERLSTLLDSHSQMSTTACKERDEIKRKLSEANSELKTVRLELGSLKRKMANSERLEEKNQKLMETLQETKNDLEKAVSGKESVMGELKDARYEVSSMKEQLEVLRRSLEQKDGSLEKELSRMSQKLRLAEHELRLSRKALKTHDDVDGRALEVASKIQREMTAKRSENDLLYSKIRQLQENLDSVTQEKKVLEESSQTLEETIQRTAEQRDQLAEELRLYVVKHGQLESQVIHLEAALEKSAFEQTSAQRQIEQYMQDVARLKLKHQLEQKDQRRNELLDCPNGPSARRTNTGALDGLTEQHFVSYPQRVSSSGDYEVEYPTSLKPVRQARVTTQAANSNLEHLLLEMRQAVVNRDLPSTSSRTEEYECDSASVSIQSSSTNVEPFHRNVQASQKWLDEKPTKDCSAVNPAGSSVFDLLTGKPSSGNSETRISRHRSKRTALDADAKALFRHLEKRIETLSKMGGSLQKENQEIAKGMKDHGKRLTKLKKGFRK